MSPQRVADAASISPYPFVVRQERLPSGTSPENTERTRPPKGKKAKAKNPRAERNPRQEEEIRFNIGPRILRPPQSARGPHRGFRFPGRSYATDQNGIPDYPPPSFQEAISTPPLSVSASTVSLVHPATVPLAIPEDIPEHPQEPTEDVSTHSAQPTEPTPTTADAADGNGSDSDESMFIIERNSVPVCSSDLPREVFKKKIEKDYMSRHGVEFPGQSSSESKRAAVGDADNNGRGRRGMRPPPLDISSKINLLSQGGSSPSSPKKRFLSLSPLRTMFPSKSPAHQDRAMSAHPSPSPCTSPYSMSRSTFFRSTSSLATSLLPMLPLSSGHKSESLSRKIFAHKSKDRHALATEHLDTWEVLDKDMCADVNPEGVEHPPSLMSAVESLRNLGDPGMSPTRSQSFTFGTHVQPRSAPPTSGTYHQPYSLSSETIHETSESPLKDRKGSTAFINRPVNRNRLPASQSLVSIVSETGSVPHNAPMSVVDLSLPLTAPPVLSPVRAQAAATAPSPAPSMAYAQHTAHVVHSSPLRVDARPTIKIDNHEVVTAVYQRALETPLPATPVYHTQFDATAVGPVPTVVRVSDSNTGPDIRSISDPVSALDAPFLSRTSPQLTITVQQHLSSSSSANLIAKTDSSEEPMTPNRHHYAGRPLPRPPPAVGRPSAVDSTYASAESSSIGGNSSSILPNSCPEGLLIDLDDTTLDDHQISGTSTPRSEDVPFYSAHHLPLASRNTSSVELLGSDASGAFGSDTGSSSLFQSASPDPSQLLHGGGFSELTDLDLLVCGLADRDHDGSDYDTLLLVSELIGPASPPRAHAPVCESGISPKHIPSLSANISLIGPIEMARRRVKKDGRVKLKLTLLDVAVNKCGICLSQFKHGDMAALTSVCQHSYHEKCLGRWLARAQTCPLCRVPLDTDVR